MSSSVSDRTVTIDLNAPVRLADAPALARRFLTWWFGELKELAPARVRRLFPEAAQSATLLVRGDTWRVTPAGGGGQELILDASASDKGLADQILEAAPGFSLSRLTVLMPQSGVLMRRIALPVMTDRDLRSAVELQVDRLSPFKAEAVRFGVRVAERDRVEGTSQVDVAIAPRASIEAVERRLEALGLVTGAIDIDAGDGTAMGFDLRAPKQSTISRRALLMNLAFVLGAVVAWYVAYAAWEAASDREVEGWQTRIAEMRPLAQRSAALRQKLEAAMQPLAMARAHKPGLTLEILSALTEVLPDDARLSELRLTVDAIELTGFASDAPGLIAKLEASKLFKEVKFRSPVMRRPELNKDRFEMSLRLEGRR